MIEYLSTGIHPLKNGQMFPKVTEKGKHDSISESIGYSPTIFGTTEELPINQIVSGDCIDIMRTFPDGVFDCCITDPPFNMSRKKGLGWAFSSHVTMQEQWDIFAQDDYFQFTVIGLLKS